MLMSQAQHITGQSCLCPCALFPCHDLTWLTAYPAAEYSELSTKDIRGVYGYQQFIALSLFLGDGLYAVAKVTFVAALGITKHIRERKRLPEHKTARTTFVGRKVSSRATNFLLVLIRIVCRHQLHGNQYDWHALALPAGAVLCCSD